MDEKKIQSLMKNLNCTREEAIQIILDDSAIDKGEKLFELTKEQKSAAKKMTITGTKTEKTKVERKRKENPEKRFLIDVLRKSLTNINVSNLEVTNLEREIVFTFNEIKYKIVLSAPRKEV